MITGQLSPRSNDIVASMRFSGNFGQPDGFGSVLTATVSRDGELALTLHHRVAVTGSGDQERSWSVRLTTEQRRTLRDLLSEYEPILCERIAPGDPR